MCVRFGRINTLNIKGGRRPSDALDTSSLVSTMWLIDSSTLELRKFGTGSAEARPPYATLSHSKFNDDDEVFFQDLLYQHSKAIDRKRRNTKQETANHQALSMKIGWLWVD